MLVGKTLWNLVDEVFWGNDVLRVTPVDAVAGECWVVAKIFGTRAAVFAGAVSVMEPGYANAGASRKFVSAGAERFNGAYNLVAWNYGRSAWWEFALDDVQIRAADAAVTDANEHFSGRWLWDGNVDKRQWIGFDGSRRFEDAGLHNVVMFDAAVWMR